MKKPSLNKILASAAFILGAGSLLLSAQSAFAATPTFTLSNTSGDSVQINVTGDPSTAINFYYNVGSASGMKVTTLGNTNSNGTFSTTISSSGYGIISGNTVYVIVNGQQSALQSWPYTVSASTPMLSPNSVTVGLSQAITVVSQTGNSIYMASNSNPSIASASGNGSQLSITGNQIGSTLMSICYTGSATNCTNLPVNVQSTSVSTLTFSQNNLSMLSGTTQLINVYGGSGTYNIAGNTNNSIASVSLSGNTVTVYSIATGNTNITVCDQSSNCGTIYIAVNTNTSGGSLAFSQANPNMSVGQVVYITITGGSNYYVTTNTNSSIVSQSISGSMITLSGLSNGNSTITVCSTYNGCGSIYVTVGSAGTGAPVSFGLTNPSVTVGQNIIIPLSGGSAYYISSNSNANVAQASISGSSLTLYGSSAGSDSIMVCGSGVSCATAYLTVTNSGTSTITSTASANSTSNISAILAQVQSLQNIITQLLTQVKSVQNQLTQLVSQLGVSQNTTPVSPSTNGTASATSYKFYNFIGVGSQGSDVSALQQRLASEGFYQGGITGYFGSATEAAVKQYQIAHGIDSAGYVGPSTRAELNK